MNRNAALLALGLMIALPLAAAQADNASTNESATPDGHPDGHPTVCGPTVNCAGGTKPTTSDNCMDGVQGNETCDGNLYYMTGPGASNGTSDPVVAGAPQQQAPAKSVPAAGVLVVVAAACVALVAARRK